MDYMGPQMFDPRGESLGGHLVGSVNTYGPTTPATLRRGFQESGRYTVRIMHYDVTAGRYQLSVYQFSYQ